MPVMARLPVGIFAPRTRAVQALAALNATDVLNEFVANWRPVVDPVERFGDEAVLDAAARARSAAQDEKAFFILFAISPGSIRFRR